MSRLGETKKRMDHLKSTLLGVGLAVGLAVACASDDEPASGDGGGGGSGRGGSGGSAGTSGGAGEDGGDNGSGTVSTYADVLSVATMIYDAVEAGEDVSPHIEAVLEAFGIPVLADDDFTGAKAQLEAGVPFLTASAVTHMAEAYARTVLTDVEGFGAGLVEQGVGLGYPYNFGGDPLDGDFLGTILYSYTIAGEFEPDVPLQKGYVLPALVRALGQERAGRASDDVPEPMWGDERLDPLQFTLLSFTIFAKPAAPAMGTRSLQIASSPLLPRPARTIKVRNEAADFLKGLIKDKLKDEVEGAATSVVQGALEVPLDKKDAAQVSVCGSLILYGHKVAMTNTPKLVWHAPKTPNFTKVEMTLTFEDDYHDKWAPAVLGGLVSDLTGCTFPRKGPIEGKPVEWSISSGLEGHGSYDLTQSMTDEDGKATASWRTVKDDYPPACQVFENQRDAVGATEAVVSGLLPGWSTVETIVTFLNPNTGGQGDAALTVLYYDVATDDPCHNE
jgi:hypothetical protein